MALKDQSGAAASAEFLARRGDATASPRMNGRWAESTKHRRITKEYFDRIVEGETCPRCTGPLEVGGNAKTGGQYYQCETDGHTCYNIGYKPEKGFGYELKPNLKVEP